MALTDGRKQLGHSKAKVFSKVPKLLVAEREIYRILSLRYATSPAELTPKEVIRMLRNLFTYRNYSDHQIRRLIRSVLRNPLAERLLEVTLNAPADWVLGEAVKSALPNLREVVVIPNLEPIAPRELHHFLGRTAAKVFAPRLLGGQRIGLGYGPAVHSFVKSLHIPSFLTQHLQFEALTLCLAECLCGVGGENLFRLVSSHALGNEFDQSVGFIRPTMVTAGDLHWAFIEINSISERLSKPPFSLDLKSIQRRGAVAEVLGQLVDRNGAILPIKLPLVQSTPLTVLKEMVNTGRGVVALAGGSNRVSAVLAAYKAGLFNYLVTDESCAELILKNLRPDWRVSELPYRDEWWERKQHFYVAYLRYAQPTKYHTMKEIAQTLTLSSKKVRFLLNNIHRGGSHEPMITIRVKSPTPEMELEMQLIRVFGLSEARVVGGEGDLVSALGYELASLLLELTQGKEEFSVGIGSGASIKAMLNSIELKTFAQKNPQLKSLTFWALSSNPLPKVFGFLAETLLASVAMDWLSLAKDVKVQFRAYRGRELPNLDAIFVELDNYNESFFYRLRENKTKRKTFPVKPAGAILLQPFDEKGTILTVRPFSPVFPLKEVKRLSHEGKPVVLVAKGQEKASALLSAYKGKLFNALVVDRNLAVSLLNLAFHSKV